MDVSRSVLTQHNDNARTGAYLTETRLKPANVNRSSFGLLRSFSVSGTMSAQPLYAAGVVLGNSVKNVLYVVTRENYVYAFDVDAAAGAGGLIWQTHLVDKNGLTVAPLPGMNYGPHPCRQTTGNVGITSTPVIDPDRATLYLVFRTGFPPDEDPAHRSPQDHFESHHYLAALDVATGVSRQPFVEVQYAGFDANMQLNRPGLLLRDGVLYLAFAAPVCDSGGNPWLTAKQKPKTHGWIFAYRAADLHLLDAFNTTQHTAGAEIWQSGNGLSADAMGNVYAFTGNNGTEAYADVDNTDDRWVVANDPEHKTELGNSILKLRLGPGQKFLPVEHITAANWFRLDTGMRFPDDPDRGDGDTDLGSGGAVVLPNGRVMGGGKQGVLYVVDPSDMRGPRQVFQAFYNTWDSEIHPCDYDKQQANGPNIHGSPVSWRPAGANYALVYGMPEKDYLKAFRAFDDGSVDVLPFLSTKEFGVRSA
jgi:hypothetical protein